MHSTKPILWGIVNTTPDSFSDGGLYVESTQAYEKVLSLFEEGADYVDIGACSSRPQALLISASEEWDRLKGVLGLIKENNPALLGKISVDTWQSKVARKALELGVGVINDISACKWDKELLAVIKDFSCKYVLMHCKGKPETMQTKPEYKNVVIEVRNFFEEHISLLLKAGIAKENIILDLGIGFGKNFEHNKELLQNSSVFLDFNFPLMAGVSRKSFLQTICDLDKEDTPALDNATAVLTSLLFSSGFLHHRVHNIVFIKNIMALNTVFPFHKTCIETNV